MNEFLTIKLSSNPADPIPWLVWSQGENKVIASGELLSNNKKHSRDQLNDLVNYSIDRTVIALLPSSDVLITPINIPAGVGRKLDSVLPFLLEDQITQDIEKMHFSVIEKQGDQAIVATVERQLIADWMDIFKEHNIVVKKMVPDCLALPLKDGCISAMHLNEQWLLRKSEVKGAAVDDVWLDLFFSSGWLDPDGDALEFEELLEVDDSDEVQAKEENVEVEDGLETEVGFETEDSFGPAEPVEEKTYETNASQAIIYSYSPLPENHQSLPAKWLLAPQEMPMVTLVQGAVETKANLLTGQFKPQASWFKHWHVWRKVAIAAVVLLVVLFIQQTVQVNQIEAQTQAYRTESERIFRSVFPNKQRIPTVSYLKRSMQDEENALSGGGNGSAFLGWMSKLAPALETVPAISIQSVQFDGTRQEIRLNAQGKDFQDFEKIRTELAKEFSVEEGQLNKNGGLVQGSYIIKQKGTGA
ncbi:MAG: type II secretion system protein GspL [Vibrio sp.]